MPPSSAQTPDGVLQRLCCDVREPQLARQHSTVSDDEKGCKQIVQRR